jgi:hypothetical protein
MFQIARSPALALLLMLVPHVGSAQQLTQLELREFTEIALSRHTVSFAPPNFDWSKNSVVVDLGGVVTASPDMKQPIDIPLRCQFIVTGIRKYRTTADQKAFWSPVLATAEARIARMLDLIRIRTTPADKLEVSLIEQQTKFNDEISTSLNRLARQHGKDGIDYPVGWREWLVDVSTVPRGGTVKYMESLSWDIYQFAKQRRKTAAEPSWTTVVQNPVQLGGMYYFHVEWPDGTKKVIRTDINSKEPLVLRK